MSIKTIADGLEYPDASGLAVEELDPLSLVIENEQLRNRVMQLLAEKCVWEREHHHD